MKDFRWTRLLPWLVISLCPPLLGHCGGAVEHGTETGNPPVVEQQKLHVVLHEEGVVVVGDPGAVSPGATVSVTNVRSRDRSEASAGTDGSVSVSVPGTLADEYEVTVSSDGRSQSVRVSAGSAATNSELAGASCDSLEQTLSEQVGSGYAAASQCQVDSDCTMGGDVGCYFTCGGPPVSVAGEDAARQSLLESTAPVCAELTRRCGPRGPMRCPASLTTAGCNNGVCQALEALDCRDLQDRLRQHRSDIVEQAPRDCTIDTDCALIQTSVRCIADCGSYGSVRASAADQVTMQVSAEAATICAQYEIQSCPAPIPLPCDAAAEPRAACVAGKCDLAYQP
jgi:hypothetical protein